MALKTKPPPCERIAQRSSASRRTSAGVPKGRVFWVSTAPLSYLGWGKTTQLGYGLGLAMGAKLAAPDRQVIAITGDGSYMFGNPLPAHFVGRARKLPTLTIICNNSMWNAVKNATMAMYPDGLASRANSLPLVDLTPSPKFEKIVESVDGYGECVTDPAALKGAIERGLDAVAKGVPAVLNVITGAGRG